MTDQERRAIMAILEEFADAHDAMRKANERFQLALADVNKNIPQGLFLVGKRIVRVNNADDLGPRAEVVGAPLNLAEEAWELCEVHENDDPGDDLIPY